MNARAVDKAEQVKWARALHTLCGFAFARRDVSLGLQLARECQHPDAQWLCSLFLDVGDTMTEEQVLSAMEGQGEDPRALFICSQVGGDKLVLQRAAVQGYAPAHAAWAGWCDDEGRVLCRLGYSLWNGEGGEEDRIRAVALLKDAAELGHKGAQYKFDRKAFPSSDWQRYRWWSKSAARGEQLAMACLRNAAVQQVKLLEDGRASMRVVFDLGAAFKRLADVANGKVIAKRVSAEQLSATKRCIELHELCQKNAKAAIEGWIGVARRLKVVKDVRVVIARMLWTESWCWCIAAKDETQSARNKSGCAVS
jgi:TPR repeat protein